MAGLKKIGTHRIRSYEVDKDNRLTLERLVNFAQDIAMAQGEDLGVGQRHLQEHNLAWVIVKFDIHLDRYPVYNEEIHISTQPVGFHKLTADRKFWFSDKDENCIGTIASQWVMLDLNKGRMKPIPAFYPEKYGFDFSQNEKIEYEKIQLPESWDAESEEVVKYSDLDFNNHVNNGRYLRWMMDAVPAGHMEGYGIRRLQVSYKKEARLGERVAIRTTLPDSALDPSYFEMVSSGGKTLLEASVQWNKREE